MSWKSSAKTRSLFNCHYQLLTATDDWQVGYCFFECPRKVVALYAAPAADVALILNRNQLWRTAASCCFYRMSKVALRKSLQLRFANISTDKSVQAYQKWSQCAHEMCGWPHNQYSFFLWWNINTGVFFSCSVTLFSNNMGNGTLFKPSPKTFQPLAGESMTLPLFVFGLS